MYQFQGYDPTVPRMVTSFKGNQKLIFEGYRYNIHHIVPAKGVKTWRCVCAKKLTSARSWCKGRAETWDNDSQGLSKGEHNHTAEHDIAELEYFKSQLILAAIANKDALLNDLISEAQKFMSEGVVFTSRESLKKSLTIARKSSENGGFKFRNYKSSGGGKAAKKEVLNPAFPTLLESIMKNTPKSDADPTLNSLMSLTAHHQETPFPIHSNTSTESEHDTSNHLADSMANNPIFKHLAAFQQYQNNNSFFDTNTLLNQMVGANVFGVSNAPTRPTASSSATEMFDQIRTPPPKRSRKSTESSSATSTKSRLSSTPKSSKNTSAASLTASSTPASSTTSLMSSSGPTPLSTSVLQQKKDSIDMAIRANRLTDIFNK
uniref:FLYWCH-type domain-containing protein n=1 Tax=Rhabditophanes sp. KR3021 TaxID=114890 RepID=A0AC35U0V8_9BILA